jgi:hypothetical protein
MDSDSQVYRGPLQTSAEFPGTLWFEVTDRQQVIHKYWGAMRVYLVCLLSAFPDYRQEADDLLQDFILKKILQPGWLEMAKPEKGRFRDFLKSSIRHFVTGELRKRLTEKRGGKSQPVSLDDLEQEPSIPEPSFDSFDVAWLQLLLAETLTRMEKACVASECTHIWRIFQARLLRPALEGVQPPPYHEIIAQFGFKSPAQATNGLATAKRMFTRHLRDVIAQYETGDAAVRAELDALRLLLTRLAAPDAHKPN